MQVPVERNTALPTDKARISARMRSARGRTTRITWRSRLTRGSVRWSRKKSILTGLPRSQRGIPKITRTLNAHSNGFLEVSAQGQQTKTNAEIQITSETGMLSSDPVKEMLVRAEKYKGQDAVSKNDLAAKEIYWNLAAHTKSLG